MITIEKAFERLYWRFGGKQSFNPNQNDLEALNRIAEFVNTLSNEKITQQQLFSKMYTKRLNDEILKVGDFAKALANVDDFCRMPLSFYVDMFAQDFNILKYRDYCRQMNIEFRVPYNITEQQRQDIIWQLNNDPEYCKHITGYWEKDKIEKSLTKQILETIEKNQDKI